MNNLLQKFIINLPKTDNQEQTLVEPDSTTTHVYKSKITPITTSILEFLLQFFDLEDLDSLVDYIELHSKDHSELGYFTTHTVSTHDNDIQVGNTKRMHIVTKTPDGLVEIMSFDIFNISLVELNNKPNVIFNGIRQFLPSLNTQDSANMEGVLQSFIKVLNRKLTDPEPRSVLSTHVTYNL